jgi:mannose-6-phosphate isomerase-like protein (cupin superfamily)
MRIKYFPLAFFTLFILAVVLVGCSGQDEIIKTDNTVPTIETRMRDKDQYIRRVVTGHRNGKSVVLDDDEIPTQIVSFAGVDYTELWETIGTPTVPFEGEDLKKQMTIEMPDAGGTRLRLVLIPPDEEILAKAKEEGVDIVEEWRKFNDDDWGMHTTDTVDYDVILSGELWMELDDGVEVHLKPGDCVIQNGTRHAWQNRSTENCVMLSVCIGAERHE